MSPTRRVRPPQHGQGAGSSASMGLADRAPAGQQLAGTGKGALADRGGEQIVVLDAVKAAGQHMQEQAVVGRVVVRQVRSSSLTTCCVDRVAVLYALFRNSMNRVTCSSSA